MPLKSRFFIQNIKHINKQLILNLKVFMYTGWTKIYPTSYFSTEQMPISDLFNYSLTFSLQKLFFLLYRRFFYFHNCFPEDWVRVCKQLLSPTPWKVVFTPAKGSSPVHLGKNRKCSCRQRSNTLNRGHLKKCDTFYLQGLKKIFLLNSVSPYMETQSS